MNESTEPFAVHEPSIRDTAERISSNDYANIYLPKKIYEALPGAYLSVGTLFILGALYVGLSHTPMVGYLAVGLSCIVASVTVNSIRRRERSKSETAVA